MPIWFMLLLLLPGSPPAGGPSQSILVNATPAGRKCFPAELPRHLPLLEELLSGRKVDPLTELAGPLVLSFHFDSNGRLASVVALETGRDAAATQAAISAARNAARVPQHGGPWSVRLRIAATPGLLMVERAIYCPELPGSGGGPALLDGLPISGKPGSGGAPIPE